MTPAYKYKNVAVLGAGRSGKAAALPLAEVAAKVTAGDPGMTQARVVIPSPAQRGEGPRKRLMLLTKTKSYVACEVPLRPSADRDDKGGLR